MESLDHLYAVMNSDYEHALRMGEELALLQSQYNEACRIAQASREAYESAIEESGSTLPLPC